MKFSLERKLILGFGSAACVLLLVTGAAAWELIRFRGAYSWMRQTYEVFVRLDQVITEMLGMEASVRGYLLTGENAALAPYQAGSARFGESMRDLRRLVADDPPQLARLGQLEPLAARALENMAARVADYRAGQADPARMRAGYVEGQRAVADFWRVAREMGVEGRRSLDGRLRRAYQAGLVTIYTAIGASLFAIACIVFAGVRVRRDLRGRQQAEGALKDSFARVEDLYNHAPCGYHSLDPSATFLEINDTALQWLGYSREEVVGQMRFSEVLTPASAELFAARYPHFRAVGSVQNIEYEWRRKDGSTFWVLLNATAVYDDQGDYVASRATVFDVSDRKHAEEERDRFFTLSRDLMGVANFSGRFLRVNPAFRDVLGFTAEEFMALSLQEFVHADDYELALQELSRLSRGGETAGFEIRCRCKDGGYRRLSWNARAVLAEQLIYASARDVTESRQSEERIRKLNADLAQRAAQLESANTELESFSYSVSHDLRAPLRHINGFASLLTKRAEAALDEESRRYVATITKSAKQMGMLIDDLLAFSRVGRAPLRRELVNQDQLVRAVIADGRYGADGRQLSWDIQPLPSIRADAAMLRQVWINLIDNAVKYSSKTPQARIAIGSRAENGSPEHVFFVRDNGVGFDMAYADQLFGVFQRLHAANEFEGTGIGLANVRRIVSRHGGRTWAESRVGEGAVFYFSIPIGSPPAAP